MSFHLYFCLSVNPFFSCISAVPTGCTSVRVDIGNYNYYKNLSGSSVTDYNWSKYRDILQEDLSAFIVVHIDVSEIKIQFSHFNTLQTLRTTL